MKCLVLGGSGFIGSHLATALKKAKHRVYNFDLKNSAGEDIRHPHALDFMKHEKFDYIFHLAALKSVPFSFLQPYEVMETNGIGTLRVLEAAKKYGVKKVIYSSSSSVYGGISERGYSIESDTPNPLSPYAVSKLVGEYYCSISEVPTISLRYFNVFGPGQPFDSAYAAVIPKFIRNVLDGKQCEIYGDGSQSRDFTYVSNVVDANILAMKSDETGIYNIACGESYSLNDLVGDLSFIIEKEPKVKYSKARIGDIHTSKAGISKARSFLNYSPKVSFEEGLRRTVEEMKKQ